MAQSFEYPMWSPHEKARLYKRFTGELPVELKNSEVITIEDNRYVCRGTLTWIEETGSENGDEQPVEGLIVSQAYITIRTNSLTVFEQGDLVRLPDGSQYAGLWIITEGVRTDFVYTPKQLQTYQYLPLSSAG